MDEDFLLVHRMKRGDEDAMDCFVRKYYGIMLTYCRYRIYNNSDSEDLVQETFLRFFKALGNYKHCGKAKQYLYKIAGNICKDYYRKHIEFLSLGELEPEEDQIHGIDDRMDLEQAMHKLPQEYQEVLVLYYFQELKLKEVAKILGIGLSLVKYRLRRGKELLKHALGKEEAF